MSRWERRAARSRIAETHERRGPAVDGPGPAPAAGATNALGADAMMGTEAAPFVINTAPLDDTASEIPRGVRLAADWTWRLLLFAAVGVLFVLLLGRVRSVVLPVFLGLLIAALLHPLVDLLKSRLRLPNALAAIVTVLVLLGLLIGGIALVATSAVKQVQQLGPTLSNGVEELRNYLQTGPLHLGSERVDALAKSASDALSSGSTYTSTVVSGASAGISLLGGFVLTIFVLFFFLKDGLELRRWCVGVLPERWRTRADLAA